MTRTLHTLLADLGQPGHRAVAEHWIALYRRKGGIPPLSAIDPLQFPRALADAWIVDAEDGDRFRIRLMGETLVHWYGRNPKGLYYEDLFAPAILPVVTQQSRQVVQAPCILYHQMQSTIPDWTVPASFERLAFPLCDAAGRIRHILGATVFSENTNFGRGGVATRIGSEYRYEIDPVALTASAAG
jgi:hypothetical protein